MNKPAPPKRPGPPPTGQRTGPRPGPQRPGAPRPRPAPVAVQPLTDTELQQLQALLDSLPATLDPLDVVMVDGYLCGVLLQPLPVAAERWLPLITDVDGRPPPARFDAALLRSLVLRRHAELDDAIAERAWFDPWVFELDGDATPSETVLPWVAGFATAVDAFTMLMDRHEDDLLEPLATLYRHLDPDDLEDADALLAEIETLAPPESLGEAVEDLVRSVLLMADVSRPVDQPGTKPGRPAARPAARPAQRPAQRPAHKPPKLPKATR